MCMTVIGLQQKEQKYGDKICIWHCFLVDKGSDRYASPDTGQAEGECLYRRQVPI